MEILDRVDAVKVFGADADAQDDTPELGVHQCLELVQALHNYASAQEDIDAAEEDYIASLENDLRADLVAREFTREVNRIIPLDGPGVVDFFDAFAAWSERKKGAAIAEG